MNYNLYKWLLLSVFIIVLTEITNKVLDFNGLLYNSVSDQLTTKQLENFSEFQDKFQLIRYVLMPLLLLIKTILIASVLFMGVFFLSGVTVSLKKLWGATLNAEFIFLLIPISKLIWFTNFQTSYSLEDIQYFYAFSGLSITGYEGLEPWLLYPLQVLNLFELGYIIYLGYQVGKIIQSSTDRGLKIVAVSYVPSLLLWATLVMFFTLNFS